MNQSKSFVDVFRPWYDCQSNIEIKFLNYSGNVFYEKFFFDFKSKFSIGPKSWDNVKNKKIFIIGLKDTYKK